MVSTPLRFAMLLTLTASCAQASAGSGDVAAAASPQVTRNPNVISTEELHDPRVVGLDALRAIRHLRPAFFRASGPASVNDAAAGAVQVSADYGPLQPLGVLSRYNTISFVEVRYLDVIEASTRFGINANSGPVILLLSNKQP